MVTEYVRPSVTLFCRITSYHVILHDIQSWNIFSVMKYFLVMKYFPLFIAHLSLKIYLVIKYLDHLLRSYHLNGSRRTERYLWRYHMISRHMTSYHLISMKISRHMTSYHMISTKISHHIVWYLYNIKWYHVIWHHITWYLWRYHVISRHITWYLLIQSIDPAPR